MQVVRTLSVCMKERETDRQTDREKEGGRCDEALNIFARTIIVIAPSMFG
jgi:hypothetical protein